MRTPITIEDYMHQQLPYVIVSGTIDSFPLITDKFYAQIGKDIIQIQHPLPFQRGDFIAAAIPLFQAGIIDRIEIEPFEEPTSLSHLPVDTLVLKRKRIIFAYYINPQSALEKYEKNYQTLLFAQLKNRLEEIITIIL